MDRAAPWRAALACEQVPRLAQRAALAHGRVVQPHDAAPRREPLPTRVVRAVFVLVATLSVAGLVGSALAPLLVVHSPLLLLALAPDARHVALSVGRLAPEILVTLVVLRRALFSIGAFGLGIIYGPSALTWVEARSRWLGSILRWLERLFARWGAPILLLLPFASLCLMAGAARTRFLAFLSATLLGHTLWVSSTYFLGTLLSDFTDRIVAFLSSNLLESTLVCVVLVMTQQFFARRRRR